MTWFHYHPNENVGDLVIADNNDNATTIQLSQSFSLDHDEVKKMMSGSLIEPYRHAYDIEFYRYGDTNCYGGRVFRRDKASSFNERTLQEDYGAFYFEEESLDDFVFHHFRPEEIPQQFAADSSV